MAVIVCYPVNMRMRACIVLSVLLVLLPACIQPGLVDGWYHVHRVVDGDTIILANVGRLRLQGIDTPELDTPAGIAARDELAAQIEGKAVRIRFARRKRTSGNGPAGSVCHDRYGRLLGSVADPPGTATLGTATPEK